MIVITPQSEEIITMFRKSLFASLVLVTAATSGAQSGGHPLPHVRPAHSPDHVAPDSATRAILHALFHGTWQGSFAPGQPASGAVELAVRTDSSHGIVMTMKAGQPARSGPGADFKAANGTLTWTQELAGNLCKTTATVAAPTKTEPQTMKGTLTCGEQASAFALRRAAE
jgi:hypothetical protein